MHCLNRVAVKCIKIHWRQLIYIKFFFAAEIKKVYFQALGKQNVSLHT